MKTIDEILKRKSWQFIVLFGVISMFGDITYESGRSIAAPYLVTLGATGAMIGFVSGLGEFVGYGFRLISGYFTDRTKSYWTITFIGYGLLIAIPLLAFTNNWQLAACFIVLERFGKAVRSPAKDAMLSFATKNVGTGFGFAIHEAIDQIGGIIGPLMFSAVLFTTGSYKQGFNLLWIPAILTIVFLIAARIKVPDPENLEEHLKESEPTTLKTRQLPAKFWWYLIFTFFSVLGFANFQILAYHFKINNIITDSQIPLYYALAMGVDAVVALMIGKAYDKIGLKVLLILPLLTIPITMLAFNESTAAPLAGIVLWGAVMAIHETIMRAAIADIIPKNGRAFAYGIFNTSYGLAWFAGSMSIGYLYDIDLNYIFWFVGITQLLSLTSFRFLFNKLKPTI